VRRFDYANAMVVYQIDHPGERPPLVNVFVGESQVPLKLDELKPDGNAATSRAWAPNMVNTIRLDQLGENVADGEVHTLRLEARGMESQELKFVVTPPSTAWIAWLGWSSGALALGIFLYSWRSLRNADTAVGT
jgi:hypothetical protein